MAPGDVPPNDHAYRVLVSEIMLQQTTVATVLSRYGPFLDRFPDLPTLAAAGANEVRDAWAGLGYYRRAGLLQACAQSVMEHHGGAFPQKAAQLAKLPGLGAYTSAAIASICFGEAIMPMDGNIERVVARLEAFKEPLPKEAAKLRKKAQKYVMGVDTGHVAQAFMDLASSHCGANSTNCPTCPLQKLCPVQGPDALKIPQKQMKKPPIEVTWHLLLTHDGQRVIMERRGPGGIMAGMLGFPVVDGPPLGAYYAGSITHRLTHRMITAHVYLLKWDQQTDKTAPAIVKDCNRATLKQLPTLMRKVAERSGLFKV